MTGNLAKLQTSLTNTEPTLILSEFSVVLIHSVVFSVESVFKMCIQFATSQYTCEV